MSSNITLKQLQERINQEPDTLLHYHQLAQMLNMLGRWQQALHTVEQGLRRAKQSPSLQALRLQTLLYGQQLAAASKLSNQLLTDHPDNSHIKIAVATQRYWQGQLPDAIAIAREGIELILTKPIDSGHTSASKPPDTFASKGFEQQLWQLLSLLAQAGVRAFPTAGTLLGLVRDGHLLPFDKDLDLGLPFSQMQLAIDCLLQQGWWEESASNSLINPRSFRHRSGLVVDLCGIDPVPGSKLSIGGFWKAGIPTEWQRVIHYPVLQLKKTSRPEGNIWLLRNPEQLLSSLYGPSWTKPDPYFDSVVGAHNLMGFSLITEFYTYLHLYQYWQQRKWQKARGTLEAALKHRPTDLLFTTYKSLLIPFL